MRSLWIGTVTACTAALAAEAQPAARARGAAPAAAAERHWTPGPPALPPGVQMAVLRGDPNKPGPYTVELSMPDGYRIPPHSHPRAERIVVRTGALLIGMGDTADMAKARRWNAGAEGGVSANMHHYSQAQGATVIAVSGIGPFAITYVHPTDDPRRQTAATP